MNAVDWFSVFELLFKGPSGWLSLALGAAATAAAGYFSARHRYKRVRVTTYAYVGGEKGFETCNESDIDDMFRSFERYDVKVQGLIKEFNQAKGGARSDIGEHIIKVAEQMIGECEELFRMNIAFRTLEAHQRFLDQIDNRRSRAVRLREEAQRFQRMSSAA